MTDGGEGHAVQVNRLADNRGVCVEASLPQLISKHHHRMSVGRAIFFRQKVAPKDRLDAHHVKIIATDQFSPEDLRTLAVAGIAAFVGTDSCRNLRPRTEVGEGFILLAQIEVVRIGKQAPNLVVYFSAPERSYQF